MLDTITRKIITCHGVSQFATAFIATPKKLVQVKTDQALVDFEDAANVLKRSEKLRRFILS